MNETDERNRTVAQALGHKVVRWSQEGTVHRRGAFATFVPDLCTDRYFIDTKYVRGHHMGDRIVQVVDDLPDYTQDTVFVDKALRLLLEKCRWTLNIDLRPAEVLVTSMLGPKVTGRGPTIADAGIDFIFKSQAAGWEGPA